MLARVRSGPRPGIFLADLVWLTRARQVAVDGLSRASLRTRDEGSRPAWKVASSKHLSARRRVGVQVVEPGSVLFRWVPRRCIAPPTLPRADGFSRRTIGHPCDGDGADGKAWTDKNRQDPTPAAGRIGLPIWPPSGLAPAQHLASGGTRAMGRSAVQGMNGLAKPGQRERCPALVRIAHAQASERAATGLPLGAQDGPYRGRRGIAGHFLRNKRLH